MVPDCVPGVLTELGILSLCIQRMPKKPGWAFQPMTACPYLSVCSPSTHDMATLREWWEEDGPRRQQFYNDVLGRAGEAPAFCEPWVVREIVMQHLYAPSLWAVFPIQDLLGMDEALRRKDPRDERINVPSHPEHYWRYRLHLTLEALAEAREFSERLRNMVTASGRHAAY